MGYYLFVCVCVCVCGGGGGGGGGGCMVGTWLVWDNQIENEDLMFWKLLCVAKN